jgi:hypothetical protein
MSSWINVPIWSSAFIMLGRVEPGGEIFSFEGVMCDGVLELRGRVDEPEEVGTPFSTIDALSSSISDMFWEPWPP